MRIRWLFVIACALSAAAQAQSVEPATVRIGVLSLFHPKTLILTSTEPLTVTLDAETLNLAANLSIAIVATQTGIQLRLPLGHQSDGESLSVAPAKFSLTVPGKLTRAYRGELTVGSSAGALVPVIAMPTELAVASIVQAESPPHASLEALKVQAIVTRSFLLAHPAAHANFDACDTTHCQFLRSPPPAAGAASTATHVTQGLVLTWRRTPDSLPQIIRAMYSRSCGGHTHAHPTSPEAYPFYAVPCSFCLRHPEVWSRPPLSHTPRSEQQRLAFNRSHGWAAIPSNTHSDSSVAINGKGTGHGVGLCQLGANDMAAHGASYEKILRHFFPNTTLLRLK